MAEEFQTALGDAPTDDAPIAGQVADDAPEDYGETDDVSVDRAPPRTIKTSTREFARRIAEAHRGKVAEGDSLGLAPVIGTEARTVPAPPPSTTAAAAPAGQVAESQAPQLSGGPSPEVVAAWEAINAERATIATERARIEADRGRVAPLAKGKILGTPDDMHGAVTALIREELGPDASDVEMREAMTDLLTELSLRNADVTIPASARLQTEQRRALRQINQHNRELAARIAEERSKVDRDEQRRQRLTTADQIGKELETSPAYRALTKAPAKFRDGYSPGEFVIAVIEERFQHNGQRLSWQEAAKLANTHFETVAQEWAPLLTAPAAGGSAAPARAPLQGNQSVQVPRTLTNAAASEPSAVPEPEPLGRFDADEHRARMRAKWNGKIGGRVG